MQVAQTQATDFDAESVYLASIEGANVGFTGLLQAIQISTGSSASYRYANPDAASINDFANHN